MAAIYNYERGNYLIGKIHVGTLIDSRIFIQVSPDSGDYVPYLAFTLDEIKKLIPALERRVQESEGKNG